MGARTGCEWRLSWGFMVLSGAPKWDVHVPRLRWAPCWVYGERPTERGLFRGIGNTRGLTAATSVERPNLERIAADVEHHFVTLAPAWGPVTAFGVELCMVGASLAAWTDRFPGCQLDVNQRDTMNSMMTRG